MFHTPRRIETALSILCAVRVSDKLRGTKAANRILTFSLIALTLLCPISHASAQRAEMFEVRKLTRDVGQRFGLTRRELRKLEPLIKQENHRTVELYARFSGEEPEYSEKVWRDLVVDRVRFENALSLVLKGKQKSAFRSARSRMEKRMLGYLIDDYTYFLEQVLELGSHEIEDVIDLYHEDTDAKHVLMLAHINDPAKLADSLETVSKKTRLALQRVLSPEQWHTFTKLTGSPELIG